MEEQTMKKIFYISLALLALVSCSKTATETGGGQIRFNMSIGSGATKATASEFEDGDAVSLYAVEYDGVTPLPLQIGGNWINNEKLTFDGIDWSSDRTLYWPEGACDFYAFYPYQTSIEIIDKYPFSVSVDQNSVRTPETLGGYEASDLLWASATNVSHGSGTVNLDFHHMMSKVVVRVIKGDKFEGDIPSDIVAHVYNTVTDCKVDWTNGSVEKDAFGAKRTITMKKISNERFEAVLVPQNIEKRTPLIELTMGGIAYLLEYSLSFRAGYCHYIDLTLNTSPDQEMIEISIDAEQGGWN